MSREARASNAALSRELGINVKTVAKWRNRDHVADAAMGPKEIHSTVLSVEEEAVIIAFRRDLPPKLSIGIEIDPLSASNFDPLCAEQARRSVVFI